MSVMQREIFEMVYALPERTLQSLKPLLSELLTNAVLSEDPSANIAAMDEWDKLLFLKAVSKRDDSEYISFEDALAECGVNPDEI